MKILFAGGPDDWPEWEAPLRREMAEAGFDGASISTEWAAHEADILIYAPDSSISDFSPYTNLKYIQNIWAGVEKVIGNPTLKVPLARMVDPGLTQGMVEYCVAHTLRYHLSLDHWINSQNGEWTPTPSPLALQRNVGILGLGQLGVAVGTALRQLGFPVHGWSRTPKDITGIVCRDGSDGLIQTLTKADILITLLPLTEDTKGVLNAQSLSFLPKGAHIINAGRGPLIEERALLEALNAGKVAHATLDVFDHEPLPSEHPYWAHPNVTVTPHIAAITRAGTAAPVVIDNLCRYRDGRPLLHLVDRNAGY